MEMEMRMEMRMEMVMEMDGIIGMDGWMVILSKASHLAAAIKPAAKETGSSLRPAKALCIDSMLVWCHYILCEIVTQVAIHFAGYWIQILLTGPIQLQGRRCTWRSRRDTLDSPF